MTHFKKDLQRSLDSTIFSNNPYDDVDKKKVMANIKDRSDRRGWGSDKDVLANKRWGRLTPIVPITLAAAIILLLVLPSIQTVLEQGQSTGPEQGGSSPLVGEGDDTGDAGDMEAGIGDGTDEAVEEQATDENKEELIRNMIGEVPYLEEEGQDSSFDDEGMGDVSHDDDYNYLDFIHVNNFLIDGIDAHRIGSNFETGFEPLLPVSDSFVRTRLPSPTYPYDAIKVEDAFTVEQVVQLKNQFFEELDFIFPAGKFYEGELLQASFLIHSNNNEEEFLEQVVEAIRGELPDTPVTVLFTTVEEGRYLTEHAIGYYHEGGQVQYLDGLARGLVTDLAGHLVTRLRDKYGESLRGYPDDSFTFIQAQGIHNGTSNDGIYGQGSRLGHSEEKSTLAKTVTLFVEGAGLIGEEQEGAFIDDLIQETYGYYESTDFAIEIYFNDNDEWEELYNPEKAVIVFPNEEEQSVYEFE
ncbi:MULTISPECIES: hypothetical protein [Bacillaceae]|uniref:Uncharacterized protein n=1 Tax=Evansella alkalicola TaxID=745819 RepID=A0ABS6K1H6_9BACI|nr:MULTISPECIES: hypothetical protein [Bacillaceae]MBU9723225.1 hypothetical protein [Bacillus alkalicola]